MKAQKIIRIISLFFSVSLLTLVFTSSALAVEPTTFPTNNPVTKDKPGDKDYPGSEWKPKPGDKDYPGSEWKPKPGDQNYPGNEWKPKPGSNGKSTGKTDKMAPRKASSSREELKHKGTQPALAPKKAPK